jgi:hypothetical protein
MKHEKYWWHRLSSLCLDSRGRLSHIYSKTFRNRLLMTEEALHQITIKIKLRY